MEGFGFDPIARFCLSSRLRKKCRDQNTGRRKATLLLFASPFESLPSFILSKKAPWGAFFESADGEIRTLKLSPADFKSAVYAVPPHLRQMLLYNAAGLPSMPEKGKAPLGMKRPRGIIRPRHDAPAA